MGKKEGVMGTLHFFPAQFCYKPKTMFKKKKEY
jgi:hypothetical protein